MILHADGIPFEAREYVNPDWLKRYGQVFHVFDQQDSGNLCFGVNGPYGKLFVKYAGAKPVNYAGRPEHAVLRLHRSAQMQEHIPHRALVPLRAHGAVDLGRGYAAIYTWIDGQCLHPLPPDPTVLHRLRSLPLKHKLSMLDDVFDLHRDFAEKGYVSVDFDDSNLLVDFALCRCYVCDIDRYQPRPLKNTKGRMPGRAPFRAPECYQAGADIDERTMVYEMGALSHLFLGDPKVENLHEWHGPDLLRRVAAAALNPRPQDRYPSMRTFLHAWRTAVGMSRTD